MQLKTTQRIELPPSADMHVHLRQGDKDSVNTSIADRWRHEVHHVTLSKMHMHVRRWRQLNALRSLELHIDL